MLEQHIATIALQKEQIQELNDEIARLKKQKPKPKISPSNLSKEGQKKNSGKRPGSAKKKKTANLEIHEKERIKPESIPPGSTFNGCTPYTVQGLKISVHNTRYLLEQWITPDGTIISGKLPSEIDGHFDNTLRTYILHQYHHCHVTQPLLLEQLREWGVDISSGQLNNILTENKESFHDEKDAILSAGLRSSSHVNCDDTGARHNGKNGYCTHIGNDFFAWFESTGSKSRINFLSLLRAGASDYLLNEDAFEYMKQKRLPKSPLALLRNHPVKKFMDAEQWEQHLKELGVVKPRHIQIATEGALFGCVLSHIPRSLVIVSDDAGQFNILNHALCWIHAERTLAKIIAPSDEKRQILEEVREQIWKFYSELKNYKESPSQKEQNRLSEKFETIFTQKTDFETLNLALQRLRKNKSELLLVLDRPEIPLHNNLSENDIREYVKKRKVSGSTRSKNGRRCRDTFASIKKTCRKLGISFWQYIEDRLSGENAIPPLPQLVEQAITASG
ncbi:MAG: transposase [Candidatus Electrothrix communis]|nr:MAG: transposase [Candidatus Electrothrix communis]